MDYEPYSKRNRSASLSRSEVNPVYDRFPHEFRVQVFYALQSAIGEWDIAAMMTGRSSSLNGLWAQVENQIRRERGVLSLASGQASPEGIVAEYLVGERDADLLIDAIELGFRLIQSEASFNFYNDDLARRVELSITELNRRFREHVIGLRFEGSHPNGFITRLDSQFIHAEVVEPAISVLQGEGFRGALDEFTRAHREYRHGHNKDAMNEALKAFESTMKAICKRQDWSYDEKWGARQLIKVMMDNRLFPSEMESYLNGVRSIFESGVPTLRNRMSGHGQGMEVAEVPDHLAAFTLHLTAANIVFLMNAFRASSPEV